jgi:hypothetical protein
VDAAWLKEVEDLARRGLASPKDVLLLIRELREMAGCISHLVGEDLTPTVTKSGDRITIRFPFALVRSISDTARGLWRVEQLWHAWWLAATGKTPRRTLVATTALVEVEDGNHDLTVTFPITGSESIASVVASPAKGAQP